MKRLCIAGVVILALLAGSEGLARLFLGPPDPVRPERIDWACRRDPHLGFTFVPGAVGPGGPGANSINALGFRGPEMPLEKAPGVYRILCVGDSVTNGVNVHNDTTYPGILQRLFAADPVADKRVEVVNAGVPGYLSDHQRYRMEHDFARLDPDCIVFLMGEADVTASLLTNETWQAIGRPRPMTVPRLEASWLKRLAAHSTVARRLRDKLENAIIDRRLEKSADQDMTETLTRAIALYKANMDAMLADCRARGIQAVIVNYPWNFSDKVGRGDNYNELKTLIKPFEFNLFWQAAPLLAKTNRELAAAWQIPLIDPQPAIYALADRRTVYDDFSHPNKKGNFLLACAVASALRADVFKSPDPGRKVPYDLVADCLLN